jgi:hypothetical protein
MPSPLRYFFSDEILTGSLFSLQSPPSFAQKAQVEFTQVPNPQTPFLSGLIDKLPSDKMIPFSSGTPIPEESSGWFIHFFQNCFMEQAQRHGISKEI